MSKTRLELYWEVEDIMSLEEEMANPSDEEIIRILHQRIGKLKEENMLKDTIIGVMACDIYHEFGGYNDHDEVLDEYKLEAEKLLNG